MKNDLDLGTSLDQVTKWAPSKKAHKINGSYVVRSDKHTQELQIMSVADAVTELASVMPASIYNSRLEILADLFAKRHIETLGYLYELTAKA